MKAIVYSQYGEPGDVLSYDDVPAPAAPGPNEVIVRVVKRMVHPIDGLMVRGIIPMPIAPGGSVPGGDGVGVVEEVGTGVDPSTGLVPGKRVVIFHAHGTWAEHVLAPAQTLIPIPDDVDDTTACQISINGITAIMLMRAAQAADSRAGIHSPILVTAAGSSVGRNVIALAQMRGLKVVATVRSDSGAEILKGVTKDLVVVSTQHENWPETVAQACGNAPMVIVDPIGGETAPKLLGLLADGGTLLVFGGLDPRPSPISTIEMAVHQYTLKGVTAPAWLSSTSAEQRLSDIADLFEMARQAPQNFADYKEFALPDVAEALAASQATPRIGAAILTSN
ncbi:zinc-binding dehydrogenase [Enterobacter ludwigii]|uniref:zinc-binding dehydrogenase n=1 Tax=Enterobacter ludwigii TaxID=299767 RepID=UPI003EDA8A37